MSINYYYEEKYIKIEETPYDKRRTNYIIPLVRNNYGKTTCEYQITKNLNDI